MGLITLLETKPWVKLYWVKIILSIPPAEFQFHKLPLGKCNNFR